MANAANLERQQEELVAVREIFGPDDFVLIERKSAWKNAGSGGLPKECQIVVHPHEQELKDRVSVVLHFKLPLTYPNTPLQCTVEKPVCLSPTNVQALSSLLNELAKSLAGQEALFEMASEAANFITTKHTIVLSHAVSLSDQLGKRAAVEEEEQAARRSAKKIAQEEMLLQEKRELMAQLEVDKQRQKEKHSKARTNSLPSQEISIPSDTFDRLRLTNIEQRMSVIKGSSLPTSIGEAFQAEAIDANSLKYPVHLLSINFSSIQAYLASSQGLKRMTGLTQDFEQLQKIDSKQLVRLYGYRIDGSADQCLEIVTEPCGQIISDMLSFIQQLAVDKIFSLVLQVISGLETLHKAGLVHKALALDKVCMTPGSSGLVKVSGASYMRTLHDINRSTRFDATRLTEDVPTSWLCPEAQSDGLSYTKSRDIWDLGLVMVGLHHVDNLRNYAGPKEFLTQLSEGPLLRVLSRIFVPLAERAGLDEVKMLIISAESSAAPAHIKSPSLPAQRSNSFQVNGTIATNEHSGPFWQPSMPITTASRYRAEFEEVEFLGKGGFGKVVKAVNKLDQNFYAIKKIRLSSDPVTEHKILREVTTWSRLSHPSIVRYHTAFVESEDVLAGAVLSEDVTPSNSKLVETDSRDTDAKSDSASMRELSTFHDEELDFNLDVEDADFLSVNPHTSSSYPRIHFGNESDESSLPSHNISRHSLPALSSPASDTAFAWKAPPPRTLYIQMEYISGRTLREAIDEGITHEEAWRIMGQMLHAMAYFTSMSITHRDLKPQNVFIDAEGHVKIGDFGLAVETKAALDEALHKGGNPLADLSDMTSGVGTSLYISPEMVRDARNASQNRDRTYASRIDMYSLGIVFFEMIHPMKTKMERIVAIKNLRLPAILFPSDFAGTHDQKQLIRSLLVHDPTQRPSPQELLQSGVLPAPLIDETVAEISRLISSSKSPHRATILKSLFNLTKKDSIISDLLFDHGSSTQVDIHLQAAKSRLANLFEQRGAVELAIDGPIPFTSLYEQSEGRRPVCFLDQEGTVVMLPYDHTVPLCRRVSRDSGLARLKRFTIGPVYRQRELGVGQPRAPIVASFDIVTTNYTLAAEAECIQLVDSVLDAFHLDNSYVHSLGHSGILQYAMQDVLPEHRASVLRFLEIASSRGGQLDTKKAFADLSRLSGVTGRVVQLFSALNSSYDLTKLNDQAELESLLQAHPKLKPYLTDLRTIVGLTEAAGTRRKLVIVPLLAVNVHLHMQKPTAYFQTSLKNKGVQTLAVGGRYDGLTEAFLPPDRNSAPSCVGVSLALAQFAHAIELETDSSRQVLTQERVSATRRCDVYVVSFGKGLEEARLGIVAELWQKGIRADLMYEGDTNQTPEQMILRRKLENVLFLVIVKPSPVGKEQTLKVRDLLRSGEEEVARTELADYLKHQIQEQNRNEQKEHVFESRRNQLNPSQQLGEVHFLVQADEKKKAFIRPKNRNFHAEKATSCISRMVTSISDRAPIFFIDLEGPVLDLLRLPKWWLSDSETYRKMMDMVPVAKKTVLHTLRDGIRQTAEEKQHPYVWLYFSRVDKGYLVALD